MSDPSSSTPAPEAGATTSRWLIGIRATGSDGRIAIWYPGWATVLWVALAAAGLMFGVDGLISGDDPEVTIFGLGFGAICTFVAWFAARPVAVADRSGLRLHPVFGSSSSHRWSEIVSLGVGQVRRGRSRGMAFTVRNADDSEAAVDGAWLGLTHHQLHRLDVTVRAFARAIGVTGPAAADPVLEMDDDARS